MNYSIKSGLGAVLISCLWFYSCSQTVIPEEIPIKETQLTDTLISQEEEEEELPYNHATLVVAAQLNIALQKDSSLAYSAIREEARKLRTKINSQDIPKDSAGILFTEFIVNRIIPHWYGTRWDFNGHTDAPGEGEVACGYFVSTTLKHMGLNINRYKLAQKAAMDGAKILQPEKSPIIWRGASSGFADYFRENFRDGLYKIGLSYHVGYIYKKANQVFFLHSSYIDPPYAVTIELADDSPALLSSTVFVITDITHNTFLIGAWLSGAEVKTQ